MKKLFSIIIAALPVVLAAQTAERQVIGSAGGFATVSGLQVSSTVGETVTTTGSTSTLIVTQGFQQADDLGTGIDYPSLGLSLNAYPNPTSGEVVLDFITDRHLEIQIGLFDVSGKNFRLPQEKLSLSGIMKHSIDLSSLAAGHYFIRLANADGTLNRSIKIQKVN